ncbi:MAG: hypothetical protein Q9190_003759 [Brigantiaea leucoxantha]
MKESLILQALKSLSSKFQSQEPLGLRQTERLFVALKGNLPRISDREHASGLSRGKHSPDHHFSSLLNNPLFNAEYNRPNMPSDIKKRAQKTELRSFQRLIERPIEVFQEQVARGAATLTTANLCLSAQRKMILASAVAHPREQMAKSCAGSAVLEWLWSSGQYELLLFLENKEFVQNLVPFLVAEGRHDLFWACVRRWQPGSRTTAFQSEETLPRRTASQPCHLLLRVIIQFFKDEIRFGKGAACAIKMFLQTQSASPSMDLPTVAGALLAGFVVRQPVVKTVDSGTYDLFVRSTDRWLQNALYYRAFLSLHHPRTPDASPALCYLDDLSKDHLQTSRHKIQLGLQTAELLVSQGLRHKAAWVLRTLQAEFGTELGLAHQSPSPEEEQSPRREERLDLGLLRPVTV